MFAEAALVAVFADAGLAALAAEAAVLAEGAEVAEAIVASTLSLTSAPVSVPDVGPGGSVGTDVVGAPSSPASAGTATAPPTPRAATVPATIHIFRVFIVNSSTFPTQDLRAVPVFPALLMVSAPHDTRRRLR